MSGLALEAIITPYLHAINTVMWGPPLLLTLSMIGMYLMIGLRFFPLRRLRYAISTLFKPQRSKKGDISAFNALMTALSSTVGTGNIAGVATAIVLGGPGAVFYMWVMAIIGMASTYTEAVCAVHYRVRDTRKHYVGGPMFYIKEGFGTRFQLVGRFLSGAYALFLSIAALGVGNAVQINSLAAIMDSDFGVAPLLTGGACALLIASVLLGGIKRIGDVAGKLVPLMIVLYIGSGLLILLWHIQSIPGVLAMIVREAFEPAQAGQGILGAGFAMAVRYGVARGTFSNEAGWGTTSIAHAAAQTNDPVRQGCIAILGTFVDTMIVCTMTALIILMTAGYESGENGAVLTGLSFGLAMPGGMHVVALTLIIFSYTTMLGWSYYGEKGVQYLLGEWSLYPYRILWVAVIPIGAVVELEFVWTLAETLSAFMIVPNVVGLALLSRRVFKWTALAEHA